MDSIFIEGLSLRGKHGVRDDERVNEQEFLIYIVAEFDATLAARTDKLEDTVNYSAFVEIARQVVEQNSFYLIERLAESIAVRILDDIRVSSVEVTVKKPEVLESGVPGVTVVRARTS